MIEMSTEADNRPYYFACPWCENRQKFWRVEDDMPLGCGILVFGGILAYLLYSDAKHGRVQCSHCGRIFQRPNLPIGWKTAFLILFWIVLTPTLVILAVYFEEGPIDQTPLFRGWGWLAAIQRIVNANTEVTLWSIGFLFVVSVAMGCYWTYQRRRPVRKRFRIEPTGFRPPPDN